MSDKNGAYPTEGRFEPQDLSAAVLYLLGIDHEASFPDHFNRLHRATEGTPLCEVLGTGPATRTSLEHA
ncbi:MAG TPA: hypothetical protein VND64_34525 [Pirellulales bacterium]|nr:hypothetical protein [Pirellulales bacterium]